MDLDQLFEEQRPLPGLIGIERVMVCYCGFTFLLLGVLGSVMGNWWEPVAWRVGILAVTFLLYRFYQKHPCNLTYIIRVFFQLALLSYWYPDIYHFAKLMPNTDHLFALADQSLFGFQPALQFSQTLHGTFWNELFNLGYFSYYLMLIVVVLWATARCFRRFDRTTVIILTSFMLYYVIFIFLQSAGPQFYFPKIGMENVTAGTFPAIGDWFRWHTELQHQSPVTGPFSYLVHMAQGSEKPIAAFPSSHVGLSTIMVWLAWKMSKKLGLFLLPFYIVLCLSTVYIGAHYAIDVLGGWISAFIIYQVARLIYRTKFIHRPRKYDALHRYGHKRKGSHQHHHHHHHHHQAQVGE